VRAVPKQQDWQPKSRPTNVGFVGETIATRTEKKEICVNSCGSLGVSDCFPNASHSKGDEEEPSAVKSNGRLDGQLQRSEQATKLAAFISPLSLAATIQGKLKRTIIGAGRHSGRTTKLKSESKQSQQEQLGLDGRSSNLQLSQARAQMLKQNRELTDGSRMQNSQQIAVSTSEREGSQDERTCCS